MADPPAPRRGGARRGVALSEAPGVALDAELRDWSKARPRFGAFVEAHRDKIGKKVRTAGDAEALADVRAELLVADRILADRRFELAFEAYGAGNRGPDLTATYRTNQKVNVEVTRLRPSPTGEAPDPTRLSGVLLTKLRQLPPGVPNVVALVCTAGVPAAPTEGEIAVAVKLLKCHADRREDAVFTRRGYESARSFYARYLRLSGVAVVPEDDVGSKTRAGAAIGGALWTNPEARQPLPRELVTALERCLCAN